MECIYIPELEEGTGKLEVGREESRHLKALHIDNNDIILISNGMGLTAECRVERTGKESYFVLPYLFDRDRGELPFRLALAIGNLDNRDRLEFAVEKSVELGVSDIFLILSDFSQKKSAQIERLKSKSIAALKQCKRARLPVIHQPLKMDKFSDAIRDFESIILADEHGQKPAAIVKPRSIVVMIGPEGGFSDKEISGIKSDKRCISWNLGNRRLRAETAAVVTLGLINAMTV